MARPQRKPPRLPSVRTTRWQGTNRAAALNAQALAAARTALELPESSAYSVYVTGLPGATVRSTSQAWLRKGPDFCSTGIVMARSGSPA